MIVPFKKLNKNAVLPKYAKEGDAGLDLTAIGVEYDYQKNQAIYSTGLAIEIPKGFVGFLFPRSSVYKTCQRLSNSVGVIDSGYRGELKAVFDYIPNEGKYLKEYEPGDRIVQLVILPIPTIEPIEMKDLSTTERGDGGFGSTGS